MRGSVNARSDDRCVGLCARALVVLGLAALVQPTGAFAGCSGAGRAWTCTAGSTRAQVQAVIDAAQDEAIVTFEGRRPHPGFDEPLEREQPTEVPPAFVTTEDQGWSMVEA